MQKHGTTGQNKKKRMSFTEIIPSYRTYWEYRQHEKRKHLTQAACFVFHGAVYGQCTTREAPTALWESITMKIKSRRLRRYTQRKIPFTYEKNSRFNNLKKHLQGLYKAGKMKIKTHNVNGKKVAEIITDEIILRTTEDGLDVLGNLYDQAFDKIIIHKKNIIPDFFELKTKIAGDILQKFTQYQMPLLIVGDFSAYKSKNLNDFIFESNKGRQVNFIASVEEALK